jgi:DNA-binding MarR family transcriptional regulator
MPNPPVSDAVLEVIPLVMRSIRKVFRSQRGPSFTVAEFRTLAFVNRNPGVSLSEVAEHIGIEAPTASKMVESLFQRGLLKRETDPSDRRRLQLSILPKGKRSVDTAIEHTRGFLAERLGHLSAEEQTAILRAMDLLKGAFADESIPAKDNNKA